MGNLNSDRRSARLSRIGLPLFLSVGLLLAGCATTPTDEVARKADVREVGTSSLEVAKQLFGARDWPLAQAALDRLLASKEFVALDAASQQQALTMAAWTAVELGQPAQARDLYVRALEAAPPSPNIVYLLAWLESGLGNTAAAVHWVSHYFDAWPDQFKNIDSTFLASLAWNEKLPSDKRLAYLQVLFDAEWVKGEPTASRLWIDLAIARIERGEFDQARNVLARVDTSLEIVVLRSDRRFDGLIERDDPRWSAEQSAKRHVQRLQAALAAAPRVSGEMIVELGIAMYIAGMHAEWLEMAYPLLANTGNDSPLNSSDSRAWVLDRVAWSETALGHTDKAVAALQQAIDLPEASGVNVSQRLNLGSYLCLIGRSDDALAMVETVGPMSGYGQMVQASIRHCVALSKQDRAAAKEALDYLREHAEQGPMATLDELLSAGHMDESAELYVRLIADAKTRTDVLLWSQTYLPPPEFPGAATERANRLRLLAREDVRAAIAKVGRVESYGILYTY